MRNISIGGGCLGEHFSWNITFSFLFISFLATPCLILGCSYVFLNQGLCSFGIWYHVWVIAAQDFKAALGSHLKGLNVHHLTNHLVIQWHILEVQIPQLHWCDGQNILHANKLFMNEDSVTINCVLIIIFVTGGRPWSEKADICRGCKWTWSGLCCCKVWWYLGNGL